MMYAFLSMCAITVKSKSANGLPGCVNVHHFLENREVERKYIVGEKKMLSNIYLGQ